MPDGSARPVPVNLRVIAATHRDLDRLVVEQDLRRDLLARLDGVAIELPPLRQRCEDVPLLIAKLLAKLAPKRPGLAFSPDTALLLIEHGWPLNVRELDQALASRRSPCPPRERSSATTCLARCAPRSRIRARAQLRRAVSVRRAPRTPQPAPRQSRPHRPRRRQGAHTVDPPLRSRPGKASAPLSPGASSAAWHVA